MRAKKYEKKVEQIVLGHMDGLMISFRKTANDYQVQRLPMKLVDELFKKAKLNSRFSNSEPLIEQFRTEFNKTIDLILKHCYNSSEKIGDNAISLNELQTLIDAANLGFLQGIKGKGDK